MKVELTLECFAGYLSNDFTNPIDKTLVDEIKTQARQAWRKRPSDKETIRILVKMPATCGQHFRYLEVRQKNENTLQIYHNALLK
ncbi:hypothetical protein A6046_01080 [[Haemophilus] ducreyi]|nr:hypothetical protein [[Haemophilus] ducreyi]AKO30843.1 hypothetical protein RY60_03625 [[Haemophilus] ducreyi]AKO32281.1 hypothetical protein RZ57_03630 [[Haemophilus] ducreyi]AKO33735.1 hypothetical protein RZ58_03645 [[Haemophilus] ducreyi]AKO35183.1 hypothetical protein RZ59_03610 [[Haemophilus] ducreyi]AKO36615.1 hypothetical protein RZ61_03650 [[Haemophilus] ducreyi]